MLDQNSPENPSETGGDAVSRETAAPPVGVPAVAADIFGSATAQATHYAAILADAGVERGLIGPREVPRLWDRHLLNCAGLRHAIADGATVLDIGSGAGLPGIPLCLARPDLSITLVEPLERRYHFLREVVAALDLAGRCHVVRARAEEIRGEFSADAVTARAVAPLEKLAAWALPLTRPGGAVLAIKGRSAADEVDEAWPALRRWGVPEMPQVLTCDTGVEEAPLTIVSIARGTGPLRRPGPGRRGATAGAPAKKKQQGTGRRAAPSAARGGKGGGAGRER
ncbi:16S rRNA (guanine(527)-N(7))-methyltransferase RsmG [Kineococcus sp. NUM-3379]